MCEGKLSDFYKDFLFTCYFLFYRFISTFHFYFFFNVSYYVLHFIFDLNEKNITLTQLSVFSYITLTANRTLIYAFFGRVSSFLLFAASF